MSGLGARRFDTSVIVCGSLRVTDPLRLNKWHGSLAGQRSQFNHDACPDAYSGGKICNSCLPEMQIRVF